MILREGKCWSWDLTHNIDMLITEEQFNDSATILIDVFNTFAQLIRVDINLLGIVFR